MSERAPAAGQGSPLPEIGGAGAGGEGTGPASPNRRAWRRFLRHRAAVVSAAFLALVICLALAVPWVSPYAPEALSEAQFAPPGRAHWFGTDVHGRDLLTRSFCGARLSLLVGAVGAGVSLLIGVVWGAAAGYLGGRWDSVLMRVVDVLYALPSIVFVIVLITTLEGCFRTWAGRLWPVESAATVRLLFLFVGLGAVSWLTMARIVRGQVLTLRTRPFVDASRALGAGPRHILRHHILPNVVGVVIVYVALTVPAIVLYESFLSYLGLGVQPPQASLGSLLAEGAQQINPVRIYWWVIVFPAVLLATTLLALNLVGDGLRDALDPRSER